MEINSTTH